MHYFKMNIGDYAKKAGRLSMIEHGAYTLLLHSCYDRERFPTLDEAFDWCWARSDEERDAVTFVLNKFFELEGVIYIQRRIQEEIDKYHENSHINKRIARERESKKRAGNTRTVHEACSSVNEPPPNQEPLTINQEPIIKNKEKKEIVQPSGFTEFWTLYPSHPRKGGKANCLQIWISKKLENKAQQILTHLAWQKKDWAKSNNDFVQMPSSYLRAAKWDGWTDTGEQKRERGFVS